MIVNYEAYYNNNSKPSIRKSIEGSDGSFIYTHLNFSNEDERENISDEIVINHINNLHDYIKFLTSGSTLIPVGGALMSEIVVEWNDIQRVYSELVQWWMFVSFREESDEDVHSESDHYHDPVTGEHTSEPSEETAP